MIKQSTGCRSFVKHARHTLSPTNMSFEAGCPCPLKLKQEKILAFSSVLPIPIVHTVFIATVLSGAEERGRRSQPGSFLFFTTSANLVLILQSVFESRRLACSAQTVCDDACWAGNAAETFQTVRSGVVRSPSNAAEEVVFTANALCVWWTVLSSFFQPGSFLFLGEIPAWPFFGKPFFGTRQYCKVTMKEVCMDGGPPAKRSRLSPTGVERVTQTARRRSTSPHGKEKILRNKGRLPPGEEVTRSVYVRLIIRKRPFFFQASRSSKQKKVSQWDLRVERSIGKRGSWAELQERSDNVERSTGTKRQSWAKPCTGVNRQSWAERKCRATPGWTASVYI